MDTKKELWVCGSGASLILGSEYGALNQEQFLGAHIQLLLPASQAVQPWAFKHYTQPTKWQRDKSMLHRSVCASRTVLNFCYSGQWEVTHHQRKITIHITVYLCCNFFFLMCNKPNYVSTITLQNITREHQATKILRGKSLCCCMPGQARFLSTTIASLTKLIRNTLRKKEIQGFNSKHLPLTSRKLK